MKAFTEPLKELGEFESIRDSLKKHRKLFVIINITYSKKSDEKISINEQ